MKFNTPGANQKITEIIHNSYSYPIITWNQMKGYSKNTETNHTQNKYLHPTYTYPYAIEVAHPSPE